MNENEELDMIIESHKNNIDLANLYAYYLLDGVIDETNTSIILNS
jgi:hypothetical protein